MNTDQWHSLASAGSRRKRGRFSGSLGRLVAALGVVVSLVGCGGGGSGASDSGAAERVVAATGWTRIASTDRYFVVANVLPGERMFTAAEAAHEHPLEGELIIAGTGRAVGPNVRHVEAHVYDRQSGLPLDNLKPTIVLFNQTTGERVEVGSTLMQDLNIGSPDIHYGNNVSMAGDSDLHLVVTIGDEEVTLDGHLD